MSSICDRLDTIKNTLTEQGIKLVAVSKTFPVETVKEAYDCGQRVFGENKVQELQPKAEELPEDIEWHMIGHLQRNKVKYIAPFVHMIHGCDSLRLLKEINKQGRKAGRVINCLLQIHIAEESTKFGFDEQEVRELLEGDQLHDLEHIRICGLMGMATNTEDEVQVRREFGSLRQLFGALKEQYFSKDEQFRELSMGMSSDYKLAVEEGSTMVRIGSAIFVARDYT